MSSLDKHHPGEYSFKVESRAVEGGQYRAFAVGKCADCGREESKRQSSGEAVHPLGVKKYFEKLGWLFDEHTARLCVCPGCIVLRKERRRGESPNKGSNVVAINQSVAAPPDRTVLTVVEREKLRDALNDVFDAPAGLYIDKSDAIVAKELDMPMALVVSYREIAFGPLKSVPELDALSSRMDEIQTSILGLAEASENWQKNVAAKGVELQEILESLRSQLKAAYAKLGLPQ